MTERRKLDWRQVVIAVLTAIIAALGGGLTTVSWQGCRPPPEPPGPVEPPEPPPPPPPTVDPIQAVGRVALRGVGCSGTVVSPRRPDGRWWIVTAAHCYRNVGGVGTQGTFITRAGQPIPMTLVALDAQADIALCQTDERYESLASVHLADADPAVGTPVHHVGFGQDRPGNREDGQVIGSNQRLRQIHYRLSVSPGDSGGGILMTAGGQLLGPVCCTTCLACLGDVAAGSPTRVREMMRSPTEYLDLPPAVMPEFRRD